MGTTESVRKGGNLFFRDRSLSRDKGKSLWEDCPLLAIQADPSIGMVVKNDFDQFVSTQQGLTSVLTDTGAAAILASGAFGQLELQPSDGTVADNDEAYIGSTTAIITPATGKDVWFEARVKFTEANTDDANIMVGLCSVYAANTLVDNGAGPAADYDGIVFYKVDGGTVWNCENSVATAQTTIASVATRTSGAWVNLGFHMSSNTSIAWYIDGAQVAASTTNIPTAAMGVLFGLKNGDTNEEKLYVDWFRLVQLR